MITGKENRGDDRAQGKLVESRLCDPACRQGGQIFMKMEKTFFADRFAMLRDRFRTNWMLVHENQDVNV